MAILVENSCDVDIVVVRIFDRRFEVYEICVMYEEEGRKRSSVGHPLLIPPKSLACPKSCPE
jgi:hypothetical protein